jgi:hypothetical protein
MQAAASIATQQGLVGTTDTLVSFTITVGETVMGL